MNKSVKLEDAVAKAKLGDLEGALSDCDKFIIIHPGSERAYLVRGLIKEKLEDIDGAIEDYQKAERIQKMPKRSLDMFQGYTGRGYKYSYKYRRKRA